jgi:hypothetical protein
MWLPETSRCETSLYAGFADSGNEASAMFGSAVAVSTGFGEALKFIERDFTRNADCGEATTGALGESGDPKV